MSHDALLTALKDARRRKDDSDHDIRILLAYAREITAPRLYRLADLAQAAGISVSGVRTAYTSDDTTDAARLLALDTGTPGPDQQHIAAAVSTLTQGRRQRTGTPGPTATNHEFSAEGN